jgi:hypothetical protein
MGLTRTWHGRDVPPPCCTRSIPVALTSLCASTESPLCGESDRGHLRARAGGASAGRKGFLGAAFPSAPRAPWGTGWLLGYVDTVTASRAACEPSGVGAQGAYELLDLRGKGIAPIPLARGCGRLLDGSSSTCRWRPAPARAGRPDHRARDKTGLACPAMCFWELVMPLSASIRRRMFLPQQLQRDARPASCAGRQVQMAVQERPVSCQGACARRGTASAAGSSRPRARPPVRHQLCFACEMS